MILFTRLANRNLAQIAIQDLGNILLGRHSLRAGFNFESSLGFVGKIKNQRHRLRLLSIVTIIASRIGLLSSAILMRHVIR
jgi:hypothetical protein